MRWWMSTNWWRRVRFCHGCRNKPKWEPKLCFCFLESQMQTSNFCAHLTLSTCELIHQDAWYWFPWTWTEPDFTTGRVRVEVDCVQVCETDQQHGLLTEELLLQLLQVSLLLLQLTSDVLLSARTRQTIKTTKKDLLSFLNLSNQSQLAS